MANFPEVPTFVKGEPGFADKLNQLGDVLRAVMVHVEGCPARETQAVKPVPTKRAPATK